MRERRMLDSVCGYFCFLGSCGRWLIWVSECCRYGPRKDSVNEDVGCDGELQVEEIGRPQRDRGCRDDYSVGFLIINNHTLERTDGHLAWYVANFPQPKAELTVCPLWVLIEGQWATKCKMGWYLVLLWLQGWSVGMSRSFVSVRCGHETC